MIETSLLGVILILLVILLIKKPTDSFSPLLEEIARNREELGRSLQTFNQSMNDQLSKLSATVETRLQRIQEDNSRKLEEMRATVDEKLHATLERRLDSSFKLVCERLELVHKGLGEMQTLAAGVGDLKKVLSNIKTRGTWGEVQLGSLLEQFLTPEQFARNMPMKPGSNERVDFAIRMPGHAEICWLPIDSKFPREDYDRLLEAQEQANPILVVEAGKLLETRIKAEAKTIMEKYIAPPYTTDFGILFLPTEGLYAEVLRRPGLAETLQRDQRVLVAGPTIIAALINCLQMGFRTLAIEKRSSEVWSILGVVKTEFGKFGDILDKTGKKLQEATNTLEDAATRSRVIQKKLKDVQASPIIELVPLDDRTSAA